MRTRFARFSLLSLLLLIGLICVSVSHLHVTYELRQLRSENDALKQDLGYITVTDPNRVYVRQLETVDGGTWRFRIYVPPQKRYMIWRQTGRQDAGSGLGPQQDQFTLTMAIRKNPAGQWELKGTLPHRAFSGSVDEEIAKRLADPEFSPLSVRRQQEEYSPDGEIELFRFGKDICVWLVQESLFKGPVK